MCEFNDVMTAAHSRSSGFLYETTLRFELSLARHVRLLNSAVPEGAVLRFQPLKTLEEHLSCPSAADVITVHGLPHLKDLAASGADRSRRARHFAIAGQDMVLTNITLGYYLHACTASAAVRFEIVGDTMLATVARRTIPENEPLTIDHGQLLRFPDWYR